MRRSSAGRSPREAAASTCRNALVLSWASRCLMCTDASEVEEGWAAVLRCCWFHIIAWYTTVDVVYVIVYRVIIEFMYSMNIMQYIIEWVTEYTIQRIMQHIITHDSVSHGTRAAFSSRVPPREAAVGACRRGRRWDLALGRPRPAGRIPQKAPDVQLPINVQLPCLQKDPRTGSILRDIVNFLSELCRRR